MMAVNCYFYYIDESFLFTKKRTCPSFCFSIIFWNAFDGMKCFIFLVRNHNFRAQYAFSE